VTTVEIAELKIKRGINMKADDNVLGLDSHTKYAVMHRDRTLMIVSIYVTESECI
jgi:hypothetical protein